MIRIIISPAKKMLLAEDSPYTMTRPLLLDRTLVLWEILQKMTFEELKNLWKCNETIARLNQERLCLFSPEYGRSPALLSYEGIQYQYLAPQILSETEWEYVTKHLCILSGLYGLLRPTDRVIPYRLEMQARLITSSGKNLYDFWGNSICKALSEDIPKNEPVQLLNLASAEYSKTILPYWNPASDSSKNNSSLSARAHTCITCTFGEEVDGKIKTKGTLAKMARGEMVRWMAKHQIHRIEEIQNFNRLGYHFQKDLSSRDNYVYLKRPANMVH